MQRLDFQGFFDEVWDNRNVDVDDDNYAGPAQPLKLLNNPKAIADYWREVQPTDFASVVNQEEVVVVCNALSDNVKNVPEVNKAIKEEVVHDIRYEKALSGGLIRAQSPKLQNAVAIVTTEFPQKFMFALTGKFAGMLRIFHPPLFYFGTDKSLMASIIVHELRHAADFLNPQYKNILPSSSDFYDNNKYAKNVGEARAFAEQLNFLLRKFNFDVDLVIRTLKGLRPAEVPSPLRMDDDILRAARIYLELQRPKTEGWLSKMAAPLMMGAASVFPKSNVAPEPPESPQITQTAQRQEVRQAAILVLRIFSLFAFSNFVKPI
jgi:hypothetical protein